MAYKTMTPEALADRVFERAFDAGEAERLLANADADYRDAFLDHLAARATLSAAEAASAEGPEEQLDETDLAAIARLESRYHEERHRQEALRQQVNELRRPQAWLPYEQAFGGDRGFLMNLLGGVFSSPLPDGFLRYVAETLGRPFDVVQTALAGPVSRRFAPEYKSAGKPTTYVHTEDFRAAVLSLPIEESLKRRWLEE